MSEALSLNDFATQLAAASTEGQAPEAPEVEAPEAEQIEETATEATEGEQSQEVAEEASEEEGQAAKAPDEELVIKWKTAAGEAHEAPLKELKDGYLRQSDYTQKTQVLAQEREKAQAAVYEQYQQAQALGAELGRLQSIQGQITQYQTLDWQAIQVSDPQQYNTLANQFLILREQGKELLQTVQGRQAQFQGIKAQEAAEATQVTTEHMRKTVPGFGEKQLTAMNSHMLGKGLAEADLPDIVRRLGKQLAPAVMEAIHEAAQWRALKASKPEIDNRAKAIPPKPAARAQGAKPSSQQEQLARVAASGKPMDSKTFASLMAQTRK
jgi:hypothetical protein